MHKLWKYFLVGGLLLSVLVQGLAKPTADDKDEYLNDDDESQQDDNYNYDEDDTSVQNKNDQDNSIDAPKPSVEQARVIYEAKPGEKIRMECFIKNTENDVVLWATETGLLTQDRTLLASSEIYTLNSDLSLTINNVTEDSAQEYTCKTTSFPVSMVSQVIVKSPARIKILVNNEETISRSRTFREGEKIRLECDANGYPTPKIIWSSEGVRLDKMTGVIVENGLVTIESAEAHHSAVYQCLAENGIGSPAHDGVAINIEYKPKAFAKRQDINTAEGETAELHCNFKSVPTGRVQWVFKNSPVMNDDKHQIKFHSHHKHHHNETTLVVKNVNMEDLGEYKCQVTNKQGQGELVVKLIYEPEPGQLEGYDLQRESEDVFVNWTVKSIQPLVEVVLFFRKKGEQPWIQEKALNIDNSKHTGTWEVQHKLRLTPGVWDARIKTKNSVGWGKFSQEHEINIPTIHRNEDEYGNDMMSLDSTGFNGAFSSVQINSILLTAATAFTARLLL